MSISIRIISKELEIGRNQDNLRCYAYSSENNTLIIREGDCSGAQNFVAGGGLVMGFKLPLSQMKMGQYVAQVKEETKKGGSVLHAFVSSGKGF